MTPDEIKLKKLLDLMDDPTGTLLTDIETLQERTEKTEADIQSLASKYSVTEEEIRALFSALDSGQLKGDKGDAYTLTKEDKEEIASTIKVPVVEKIIEKTEVIKERPVVTEITKITNEIKEVAVSDTAEDIRNKLELLTDEERLDASAIKNLPKGKSYDEDIATLQNRTQLLNQIVTTRFTQTDADARYLEEANNLSDLDDVAAARTNLGLVAGGAGDIWVEKAGDTMTGALTTPSITTTSTGTGLSVGDGSVGNPAIKFTNGNIALGIYSDNTNNMSFVSGGVKIFEMQKSSITEFLMMSALSTGQVNFSHAQGGARRFTTYIAGSPPFYSIYNYALGKNVITLEPSSGQMSLGNRNAVGVFNIDASATGYGYTTSMPLIYTKAISGLTADAYRYQDSSAVTLANITASGGAYFAGNVGIGQSSPTAVLHLKAGTTVANTAPLKFTTGSLLTTPEAGAIEFLTDAYYATITTGAARRTFAFLESPTFTGTPTLPTGTIGTTQTAGDSTTAVATTAFVTTADNLKANLASPTFTGTLTAPTIVSTTLLRLKGYTVATLPAGTQGDKAFVTDALGPTYLATVVGGGVVVTEVFYNGTNWVCT